MKSEFESSSKIVSATGLKIRRRRRERQELIMEILKMAKNGTRKTQIIEKIGLSSSQLKRYLKALEGAGFLSCEDSVLKTTEKGRNVIEACRICHSLVKEV